MKKTQTAKPTPYAKSFVQASSLLNSTTTHYIAIRNVTYPKDYASRTIEKLTKYTRARKRAGFVQDPLRTNLRPSFQDEEEDEEEDERPAEQETNEEIAASAQTEREPKRKFVKSSNFLVFDADVYEPRDGIPSAVKDVDGNPAPAISYLISNGGKTNRYSGTFYHMVPYMIYRVCVRLDAKFKSYKINGEPELVCSIAPSLEDLKAACYMYIAPQARDLHTIFEALQRKAACRPVGLQEGVVKSIGKRGEITLSGPRILRISENDVAELPQSETRNFILNYYSAFAYQNFERATRHYSKYVKIEPKTFFNGSMTADALAMAEILALEPWRLAVDSTTRKFKIVALDINALIAIRDMHNKRITAAIKKYASQIEEVHARINGTSTQDTELNFDLPETPTRHDALDIDLILRKKFKEILEESQRLGLPGKAYMKRQFAALTWHRCYLYAHLIGKCLRRPMRQLTGNSYWTLDQIIRMFFSLTVDDKKTAPDYIITFGELVEARRDIANQVKNKYTHPNAINLSFVRQSIYDDIIKALMFLEHEGKVYICTSQEDMQERMFAERDPGAEEASNTDYDNLIWGNNVGRIVHVYNTRIWSQQESIVRFINKKLIESNAEPPETSESTDQAEGEEAEEEEFCPIPTWEEVIDPPQDRGSAMRLNETQRQAARALVAPEKQFVMAGITGGAGTGKSTVAFKILECFNKRSIRVTIVTMCSRLSTRHKSLARGLKCVIRTGTVDRLYSIMKSPNDHEFKDHLRRTNIFVIDEAQNQEIQRFRKGIELMLACEDLRRVLFVGDPDQILPIGEGKPFDDILNSERILRFHLTEVNRGRHTTINEYVPEDENAMADDARERVLVENVLVKNAGVLNDTVFSQACTVNVHHLYNATREMATGHAFPIPDCSVYKLESRLLWGDAVNMDIMTTQDTLEMVTAIEDMYTRYIKEYSEISVNCRGRAQRDLLNAHIHERVRPLVIKHEKWPRKSSTVKIRSGNGEEVGVGTKICFKKNYNPASMMICPENEQILTGLELRNGRPNITNPPCDNSREIREKIKKLKSKRRESHYEFGTEDNDEEEVDEEDDQKEDMWMKITSNSVDNGESDWICDIVEVTPTLKLVQLAESSKIICISKEYHIDPADVDYGYVATLDSQMGNESAYSILCLDYGQDTLYLDRNRLVVALTRATKRMLVLAEKVLVPLTKTMEALAYRESINDRPNKHLWQLRNALDANRVRPQTIWAKDILNMAFTNPQRTHQSDMSQILKSFNNEKLTNTLLRYASNTYDPDPETRKQDVESGVFIESFRNTKDGVLCGVSFRDPNNVWSECIVEMTHVPMLSSEEYDEPKAVEDKGDAMDDEPSFFDDDLDMGKIEPPTIINMYCRPFTRSYINSKPWTQKTVADK